MSQDQQIFSTAILSPQRPVPAGLTNGQGKAANQRFSVISKLLGEQYFKNIADLFVRQHPPLSPVIDQYGDGF